MSTTGRVESATSHYLPRFARIAKDAKVRQIGYSVDRDPLTGRITFTYNITWTDVDDSLVQKYEILKMNLTRRTARVMRDEEGSGLPRLIKCDGACDRWAPENYIIQFGLCDHNICYRCYETEESIALTNDGSRGCCNKECVARAKAELALKTPNCVICIHCPLLALTSRFLEETALQISVEVDVSVNNRLISCVLAIANPGEDAKDGCVCNAQMNGWVHTDPSSKSAIALGSRAFYVPFPGNKNRRKQTQAHGVPARQTDARSRPWKSKPQAVNSEATFFGDYDDARLQKMAETMRLTKV